MRRRDAGHRALLEQERAARRQAEAERASLAAKLADQSALEQEQTMRLVAQTERDALAQQLRDLQDQTARA